MNELSFYISEWYKAFYTNKKKLPQITFNQISRYEKKLLNKKIKLLDIEILKNKKGDILKIFNGKSKIRECYISYVNKDTIKAWRYHRISEQKFSC